LSKKTTMKKHQIYFIQAILISLLLGSCNSDSKYKAIDELVSNHEQTYENSKIDLNFKVNTIEQVKDFLASDSAKILELELKLSVSSKIEEYKDRIKRNQDYIEHCNSMIDKFKSAQYGDNSKYTAVFKNKLNDTKEQLTQNEQMLKIYQTTLEGTELETIKDRIACYKSRPNEILFKIFKINYTINNPTLNMVKQTTTKYYFIKDYSSKSTDKLELIATRSKVSW